MKSPYFKCHNVDFKKKCTPIFLFVMITVLLLLHLHPPLTINKYDHYYTLSGTAAATAVKTYKGV